MLSDKVMEQSFAVRVLKSHLVTNRLAHTYLLTGKEDTGKEELALAFAAALNCEKSKYFSDCGCVSCGKVEARNHPDVIWVGVDPKSHAIKIEEVRMAVGKASLKPYEGKWKVFILAGADRLTTDASNALLKTLEEPPAHTLFILLVEAKAHLLETIQSRSFEVRLRPMVGMDFEDVKTSATFASFAEGEWEEILNAYQGTGREEIKKVCDLLMRYFRNRIQKNTGSDAQADRRNGSWLEAIDIVYETKDAIDGNVNQKLALSRLAMQLRRIFNPLGAR